MNLLTYDQVAKKLGICRRSVNRLVARKKLRVVRLSYRTVRFRETDLESAIEKLSAKNCL